MQFFWRFTGAACRLRSHDVDSRFDPLAHHFLEMQLTTWDEQTKQIAEDLHTRLKQVSQWNKETIFAEMKEVLKNYKIKMNVLYKILTGSERGLPLPESLEILGKEKTLERISNI